MFAYDSECEEIDCGCSAVFPPNSLAHGNPFEQFLGLLLVRN